MRNFWGKLESYRDCTALGIPSPQHSNLPVRTHMQLISPDSTCPLPSSLPPGCVPRGTDLPLVLGEQLGAAEEVLIPGERDDRLWELSKVELQQGGHCVHVCGAGMKRETWVRAGTQAAAGLTHTLYFTCSGQSWAQVEVCALQLGSSGANCSCPWSRSGPGCPQAQEAGPLWGV